MSPLRRRLIEDMQVRNLSGHMQRVCRASRSVWPVFSQIARTSGQCWRPHASCTSRRPSLVPCKACPFWFGRHIAGRLEPRQMAFAHPRMAAAYRLCHCRTGGHVPLRAFTG